MIPRSNNAYTKNFDKFIGVFEIVGLTVIAFLTVILMATEMASIIGVKIPFISDNKEINLGNILLMFIYLEVLAMAGVYLKDGKLPIRIPVYIAIVALARFIIIDSKNLAYYEVIGLSAGILVLTVAVLIMRYGQSKYPYHKDSDLHYGAEKETNNDVSITENNTESKSKIPNGI